MNCPFCNGTFIAKSDGNGRFYECENHDSLLYNTAVAKRNGLDIHKINKYFQKAKTELVSAKQVCDNCGKAYHEETEMINGYKFIIYVCVHCFEFIIRKRDKYLLATPKIKDPQKDKYEKNYSDIDDQLNLIISKNQEQTKQIKQIAKISTSRRIGFFIFIALFILLFIRLITNTIVINFFSGLITTIGFIFGIFLIFMFFFGKKVKKYIEYKRSD